MINSLVASSNPCPASRALSFLRRFLPTLLVFAIHLLPLPRLLAAERAPAEVQRVTQRVLDRAILVDTHADTPQMMLDEGYDLADPGSVGKISIRKMREGGLDAVFFSIWV